MNRKGFTLVEILIVVAIVSILSIVVIPNVFVMIDKNNVKSCNSLKKNIESAAKIYVSENKYNLDFGCDSPDNKKNISFQTLIDYGSLKVEKTDDNGNIINPVDDKPISIGNIVEITYNCDTKEFTYNVNGIDCVDGETSTNDKTTYMVNHWQQNLGNGTAEGNANYTKINTDNLIGTAGSKITPAVKIYTGFKSPSTQTVTIKADGTTVVDYYYTRNSYTVTLTKGTGIVSVSGANTYKYGENVTINAQVSSGYIWKNWTGTYNTISKEYKFTMPASDVSIKANALADSKPSQPNIVRNDYNTFSYVATDLIEIVGYYVSTSSEAPLVSGTSQDTFALNKWTKATSTGNLTLSAGTYYVWAINAAGIISDAATINAYTVTKNQGNGTVLTTRYDSTSSSTGTVFSSSMVVLHGTNVWAQSSPKTGYNSPLLTINGIRADASLYMAITKNTTIGSTATANTYTVSYDANGGSGAPAAQTKKFDVPLKISSTIPVRDEHVFLGWSTSKNATSATYSAGGTFTSNSDTTLYAVWRASMAYAVYSTSDKSLTFYKTTDIITEGSNYRGKVATSVYTGFETATYTYNWDEDETANTPWYEHSEDITKVEFVDVISPVSTAVWFYNFVNCEKFDLDKLDTSNTIQMNRMFGKVGYNLSQFNIDLSDLDTSSVKRTDYMFWKTGYSATDWYIGDLSGWNLTNNTATYNMFDAAGYSASEFNVGDIGKWNVSKVTSMDAMFSRAGYSATTWYVGDLGRWSTSSLTSIYQVFSSAGYNATKFNIGNIGNWNTSKITNISEVFSNCGRNATEWYIGDLGDWDVANITEMKWTFTAAGRHALTWSVGDISDWDTTNVTHMQGMFMGIAFYATTPFVLDLSGWDTAKVVNMSDMFDGAYIYELNISGFDTSKVADMSSFFGNNPKLYKLILGNKFSLTGNGSTSFTMLSPWGITDFNGNLYPGTDGKWYDYNTGESWHYSEFPSNRAGTYVAALSLAGLVKPDKPTITRNDYNTFSYTATGATGYYVSNSSAAPTKGDAIQSTFALDTWTSATSTGDLSLSSGIYYVWSMSNSGTISEEYATIKAYTVTRSQNTGSSLVTRYDSTSSSTGTEFNSNIVVLHGTNVWAMASPNTGYNYPSLTINGTPADASLYIAITKNMTIGSTATINTYTVSYDANGGSGAPAAQTKKFGISLEISSTIPVREEYVFLGWSTIKNATSAMYHHDDPVGKYYTLNESMTLYAVWQPTLIGYIRTLYASGNPQEGSNTKLDVKYYQAYQDVGKTWGLMNDGYNGVTKVTNTTALSNGTQGNIRYFGKDPNNYIYFNCDTYPDTGCEVWRIVGIVDGKVKIVKNDSIGNMAWHHFKNNGGVQNHNSNDWSNSSLQKFLNGKYYKRCSTNKVTYYSGEDGSVSTTLNLANIGIKANTRGLISPSTWYLGGYVMESGLYADDVYLKERTNSSDTIYSSTTYGSNPFTLTNTKLGLIYSSDHLYAVDLDKCSYDIYNYYNSSCSGTNYLNNGTKYWVIAPHPTDMSLADFTLITGDPGKNFIYYAGINVHPAVYLEPDLLIEFGNDGSLGNAFRLGADQVEVDDESDCPSMEMVTKYVGYTSNLNCRKEPDQNSELVTSFGCDGKALKVSEEVINGYRYYEDANDSNIKCYLSSGYLFDAPYCS